MEWIPAPHNLGFYESIEAIIDTHGHGGSTTIHWKDGPEIVNGYSPSFSQAEEVS